MENIHSGCYKKIVGDTRNNWVTMMFTTKNRYMCFSKQSHINTCVEGFYELERFGFEFRDFGFAGNHVHFQVNIPKKYSLEDAEIMLKSWSAKRIFEKHPGFHKRYSRGSFWSGYEHHVSTGLIIVIYVISNNTTEWSLLMMLNKNWMCFSRRAGMRHDRTNVRACRGSEGGIGVYKGAALISLSI